MKLLEKLIMTPGIAGREHRVRELILRETKGMWDETRVDPMGSLICVRKPRPAKGKPSAKPLKVMLAAHMDQIGFIVRYIDDKGFMRVNAVGGFDTRNLFARIVKICPVLDDPSKDVLGVLNPGGKPVHIASDVERKSIPEINDLLIDTGLTGEEVKKRFKIGDMVVMRATFDTLGNTAVGQAMDNRVACWLAIESVRKLKHHDCEIHAVFTVQEEVGCRGAGTASYHIEPDVAIALDVTLCCDTPGVPDDQRVTKMGDGAGIHVMDSGVICDIGIVEEFERVAVKNNIKHQRTLLPRGGTDAATIQQKNAGRRVMTLVCPTRYVHTVTEMISIEDLNATRDLLAAYLGQAKA